MPVVWRLKTLGLQHAQQFSSAKNFLDPKLLTTKPQLQIWSSEEKYLFLIIQKESVASNAIAENRIPLPVPGVDAALWTTESEKTT